MSDSVIYISLFSVILILWIREAWIFSGRRKLAGNSSYSDNDDLFYEEDDDGDSLRNPHLIGDEPMLQRTVKVIGCSRFTEMSENLVALTDSHRNEGCRMVHISCASGSRNGRNALHHLLPGDAVCLTRCLGGDGVRFDVFSKGTCVGRISGDEAEIIARLMHDFRLTGVYVWNQRSYGNCRNVDVELVMFCDTVRDEIDVFEECADNDPSRLKVSGNVEYFLMQN